MVETMMAAGCQVSVHDRSNHGWQLVKLTYIHPQKCNATLFEATLALDSRNKVTAKYSFASEHGHVKYTYLHGRGTTLEPSYDFQSQSWHFGIGHKFGKHDHAKAVYDGHNKNLGLEWTQESKEYGHFKVTATVPVKDYKLAKMVAEKTWSVDI
ncbi:unnamed protein product [Sphagnum jensenii]|uniref:Uncharacterized protein n=1 Tax=Sphagnum jensenii TaxID=128206 RepID=A0ABP0VJK5_9BRYO